MLTPLATLLLLTPQAESRIPSDETKLTFGQIEQKKYETFSQLKRFTGRYVLATLPEEGVGERQEVFLTLGESGRKSQITLNGRLLLESARSTKNRWLVSYTDRQYVFEELDEKTLAIAPFVPLRVQTGSINFRVDESGMRFGSDPEPTVLSRTDETLDSRKVTKIVAKADNASTRGIVDVVQWFDQGTWIVRRFEITVTAQGKQRLKIVGTLQDANFKSEISDSAFNLPALANGFQRVRP
ncbi:MAG: hypothetical protein MUC92_00590 [Fimbriimonadaceae bacterium]|jgi:hypothetical protein|nr:hypothetical protein [Fimbriimonadaceae bacterium]